MSLHVPFQKWLITEGAGQLVETKVFLLDMPPTVGLHREVSLTDGANETTVFLAQDKILDA